MSLIEEKNYLFSFEKERDVNFCRYGTRKIFVFFIQVPKFLGKANRYQLKSICSIRIKIKTRTVVNCWTVIFQISGFLWWGKKGCCVLFFLSFHCHVSIPQKSSSDQKKCKNKPSNRWYWYLWRQVKKKTKKKTSATTIYRRIIYRRKNWDK